LADIMISGPRTLEIHRIHVKRIPSFRDASEASGPGIQNNTAHRHFGLDYGFGMTLLKTG